jgi:ferrochelatase
VPIAFVSDHIETLVELDIENRELAESTHVPGYFRAKVPNDDAGFIAALAGLARRAVAHGDGLCSHRGGRACDVRHADCPWASYGVWKAADAA